MINWLRLILDQKKSHLFKVIEKIKGDQPLR